MKEAQLTNPVYDIYRQGTEGWYGMDESTENLSLEDAQTKLTELQSDEETAGYRYALSEKQFIMIESPEEAGLREKEFDRISALKDVNGLDYYRIMYYENPDGSPCDWEKIDAEEIA